MTDPTTLPENRSYRPREEQIFMDKQDGNVHVKVVHKPTGVTVEGTGDDLDSLLDSLRDDLSAQVESFYEAEGRLKDSAD